MIVAEVRDIGWPWFTSEQLRALLAQDDVTLLIDGDGGVAVEAVSIAEVIRAHPGRVSAHVQGRAQSACALVLMACERRTGSSGSLVKVHNPFGCACGDAATAREWARDMTVLDRAVRDTIGKGRDAAASLGGSIRDSINSVRATRDSVVMVRLSKDSLASLDELVDAGVTASRSEAAAFLIGEGIAARADLFDKISEQTRIIREAREKLRQLLEEGEEERGDCG